MSACRLDEDTQVFHGQGASRIVFLFLEGQSSELLYLISYHQSPSSVAFSFLFSLFSFLYSEPLRTSFSFPFSTVVRPNRFSKQKVNGEGNDDVSYVVKALNLSEEERCESSLSLLPFYAVDPLID